MVNVFIIQKVHVIYTQKTLLPQINDKKLYN